MLGTFKRLGFAFWVDPVAGNNSNSGLTRGLAWKTTPQADALALAANQRIAFVEAGAVVLYRRLGETCNETAATCDVVTETADKF